jgi:hypothetical protein
MTVLALALILGSISVASAASGKVRLTDIDGNANEEAIQVAYDLNIVEGTPEGAYEPEKAINRAEFAALITRALAIPESARASYTTTTYKDTSGYGWAVPYLAILQQKGIMKGDGYGNAMPGRQISPNEAVTMILRAIGYTDNASVLVGQWPANYVSLGQSQLLYEKVSNDVQMNKASAAQMIYNALTKQLVQVDANSTVKLLYDAEEVGRKQTLLTTGLNCYQETDNTDENGKTIVSYNDARASKINLMSKVGAYGILYKSRVDDEVVALTEVETTFIAGKFTYNTSGNVDKFQDVNGTKYNLSDSAKTIAARIAGDVEWTTGAAVKVYDTFINGNDDNYIEINHVGYTVGDFTKEYYKGNNANAKNTSKLIVSAKVSGVTITELRAVAVWEAGDILTGFGDHFLYEADQIDGKKFNGHEFPLDVNNEVDEYGYVLEGVNSLDDLAADNVVYIYKDGNKVIRRIEVGTETQSGSITNINTADKTKTVGGKVLGDAPYENDDNSVSSLKPGDEGTALLDVWGRTFAFKLGEASKGNFAVVLGRTRSTEVTETGASYQYRILDKTGTEVVYTLKSGGNSGVDPGSLIEYRLTGGKIDILNTTTGTGSDGYSVAKTGALININGTNTLLDSGALVFIRNDDGDYSLGNVKDLLGVEFKSPFKYIRARDGNKAVMGLIVDSSDAGAQSVFVLINSISSGWDGSGDIDVVHGLDFAKGVGAAQESWNYKDTGLTNPGSDTATWKSLKTLQSNYSSSSSPKIQDLYPTIVKFSIDVNGVLKNAAVMAETEKDKEGDVITIVNARFVKQYNQAGSFSIEYTTNTSISLTPGDSRNSQVGFTSNAVLYTNDGKAWTANRVRDYNFKADKYYTLLKSTSDADGFNIVIEQQKYRSY